MSTEGSQNNQPENNMGPSAGEHLDIKKMKAPAESTNSKELAKQEKMQKAEAEKQAKLQKAEQEKQAKLQKAEQDKQAKLLKEQEKKNKKDNKKGKEDAPSTAKNSAEDMARTDAVNEFFKTPPAGVYPKTDKQGRVIKYKKRGGVFAFFVGIFFTLFLFVFCGGLVASYFYYCYKIEDAGKMLGVDTSFLPQDTKNKTANELVSILLEYKDGYTNMTVADAKSKLGLDVQEVVEKNLGIEIEDFNEIQITLKKVNSGNPIKIKDLRIQDIINNSQDFIDALLPELYKKVNVSSVLDLANIKINLNKPLINDEIFDITPNPTFVVDGVNYLVNFAMKTVENKNIEFSAEIRDGKFTIHGIEYTISDDRTKLTYSSGEIVLTYNHTYKRFEDLTIDEVLNSIIPNYVGGESLTIGFLQEALDLNIVDSTDPDYDALLRTNLNNLKIDKLLDSVSIRAFEKLLGINTIPLDDARYEDLLNEKLGQLTTASVTENLTMGAFLDLLHVTLPDLPFLEYSEFRDDTLLADVGTYAKTLKVGDFLNNVIEEVHPYSYFEDGEKYYLDTENQKVFTKAQITSTTNPQFAKIGDEDLYSYSIEGKNYLLYKNYLYRNEAAWIAANQVEIAGVLYNYNSANQKLVNATTFDEIEIVDSKFFIDDGSMLQTFGKVSGDQVVYYNLKPETKTVGRIFRINFMAGLDPGFTEDTTITYKLDKNNNLEYLDEQATIDEFQKFTIGANEYTIGDGIVTKTGESEPFEIVSKSTTLQIAVYALSDLTIQNVLNGDLSEIVSGDAKLSNLLLTDILNKEFSGLLKNLNGLTIGEIVDSPDVLIDGIKDITLGEMMDIDDSASPLLKALKDITIDDLMTERAPGEENPLIAAMGTVTFFDLGVKNSPTYLFDNNHQTKIGTTTYTYNEALEQISDGVNSFAIITDGSKKTVTISTIEYRFVTDAVVGDRLVELDKYNPLVFILEKVKISDVLEEDGLFNIIKAISLSDITESNSGIMKILGDITFDDFSKGDAITNKLTESYASLAELLDQKIYFYDHFNIGDNLYYFVDNMETLNGLYEETNKYEITFTKVLGSVRQTFEYEGNTYILSSDGKLRNASDNQVVQYLGDDVNIVNNTFVFVANKIFIASGSYVYELTKDATPYVITGSKVTEWDGNAVDYDIMTASTLNKAVLSLRVCDLFEGNFTSKLTEEVQSIKLVEILGDVSGNKLLSALTSKNPNVTISTLGDTINTLTMGEVFTDVDFTTGILSLIDLENTQLLNVAATINNFDFSSQTMADLLDKGIIDFNEYDGSHNVTKDRNTSIRSLYGTQTLVGFVKFIYDQATGG